MNTNQLQMMIFSRSESSGIVDRNTASTSSAGSFQSVLDGTMNRTENGCKREVFSAKSDVRNTDRSVKTVSEHETGSMPLRTGHYDTKAEDGDIKESGDTDTKDAGSGNGIDGLGSNIDVKDHIDEENGLTETANASEEEASDESGNGQSELPVELLSSLIPELKQLLNENGINSADPEEITAALEKAGVEPETVKALQTAMETIKESGFDSRIEGIVAKLEGNTRQQAEKGSTVQAPELLEKLEIINENPELKQAFQKMQQAVEAIRQKVEQGVEVRNTDVHEELAANPAEPGEEIFAVTEMPVENEGPKDEKETEGLAEDDEVQAAAAKPISAETAPNNSGDPDMQRQGQYNNDNYETFQPVGMPQTDNSAPVQFKSFIQPTTQELGREVMDQIIDNAKVVVDENKSELVMDLKPESLGKLSLKIVHERGQVMAKFIAENDQVKAVLESNMQLLKDSLQKQGLSVQSFSVSVGEDSRRQQQFSRRQMQQKPHNSKLNQTNAVGASYSRSFNTGALPRGYYNNGLSSINLTA